MYDDSKCSHSPGQGPSASEYKWHILHAGKTRGPFSRSQLIELAAVGDIAGTDLVQQTGGPRAKARDVEFLRFAFFQDIRVGILVDQPGKQRRVARPPELANNSVVPDLYKRRTTVHDAGSERRGLAPQQPPQQTTQDDGSVGATPLSSRQATGTVSTAAWVMLGVGIVFFLLGNVGLIRFVIWGIIFGVPAYLCFTDKQRRGVTILAAVFLVAAGLDGANAVYTRTHVRPALGQTASAPADRVLVGPPRAPGPSLPPDQVFVRCSPAVVQLVIQDKRGRTISDASGFLVNKNGLIVTNYHVIRKAYAVNVSFPDKTVLSVAGVAAFDEQADIAIIKVGGQVTAQPLELAGDDLPPIGTKVYAIGNPLGVAMVLSDGLVSSHTDNHGVAEIMTTAAISPGSSGGPLLGADGRVVGVITAFFKGGQNLNIAIPVARVARLVSLGESEGKLRQFPLIRRQTLVQPALDYNDRGNELMRTKEYNQAIIEFGEAIRLDPNYAEAYSNRGFAWWNRKDYDNAIRDYNVAIRLDPDEAFYYASRGNAWLNKKNYENAITDFSEAIRLDPDNALVYSCRGDAWLVLL